MNCNLKMVLLIYNISINDEVMALFEGSGAPCFTQWPRVVGKGVTTGPKMDNDVWPGANSAIMTILPEDRAKKNCLMTYRPSEMKSASTKASRPSSCLSRL